MDGALQRPHTHANSKLGSCLTVNDTERAIKHFSAAASCSRRAIFSSAPAASLACGRNVTLSNCPALSACSISTPGGIVAVRKDDDAGIGAKVQVPELMTGG
jgi:hypothetical protein